MLNPPVNRASSDLVDAIDTFKAYLDQSGIGDGMLAGARILEIGPGANQSVALQFIAAGAEQVISVDKFVPQSFTAYHAGLYRDLRERLPFDWRGRFDDAVDLDRAVFNQRRILYVYSGVECVDRVVEAESADLILSNSVLEEIYDVDAVIDTLDGLLRPGGLMIHKIDFRDYGMFSAFSYSPFEFLTIPEWIYKSFAAATGQPNRRLIGFYRDKFQALGYETRFTELFHYPADEAAVDEIRSRLCTPFRQMPAEDLLVSGAWIVARKPGGSGI